MVACRLAAQPSIPPPPVAQQLLQQQDPPVLWEIRSGLSLLSSQKRVAACKTWTSSLRLPSLERECDNLSLVCSMPVLYLAF